MIASRLVTGYLCFFDKAFIFIIILFLQLGFMGLGDDEDDENGGAEIARSVFFSMYLLILLVFYGK